MFSISNFYFLQSNYLQLSDAMVARWLCGTSHRPRTDRSFRIDPWASGPIPWQPSSCPSIGIRIWPTTDPSGLFLLPSPYTYSPPSLMSVGPGTQRTQACPSPGWCSQWRYWRAPDFSNSWTVEALIPSLPWAAGRPPTWYYGGGHDKNDKLVASSSLAGASGQRWCTHSPWSWSWRMAASSPKQLLGVSDRTGGSLSMIWESQSYCGSAYSGSSA